MKALNLFLITLLLFISCEKDEPEKVDPRRQYVGIYKGKYEWHKGGNPDVCSQGKGEGDCEYLIELGSADTTLKANGTVLNPDKNGGYSTRSSNSGYYQYFAVKGDSFFGYDGYNNKVCSGNKEFKTFKVK